MEQPEVRKEPALIINSISETQ